jgi:hypothetical protein
MLSNAVHAQLDPVVYSLLALATYFPCPCVTEAFEVVSRRYDVIGAGGYARTV